MPFYTFENPKNGKIYELNCSYEEMESFKKKNPTYNQVFSVNIADPVRLGVIQPPSEFQKNVIEKIKREHPRHQMHNSRFRTSREI